MNTENIGGPWQLAMAMCDVAHSPSSHPPAPGAVSSMVTDERTASRPHLSLPAPRPGAVAFLDVLRRRKAVRTFADVPVEIGDVATLLDAGCQADRDGWPDGLADLELLVAAWRVRGLPPTLFRYEPAVHALVDLRSLDGVHAPDLVLQVEFATAPVLFLIAGDMARCTNQFGPWGYRQLLLRAGEVAQQLWLTAVGLGLSGSIFAGLIPSAANRVAGLDGYRSTSLLAFAAGYPLPSLVDRAQLPP